MDLISKDTHYEGATIRGVVFDTGDPDVGWLVVGSLVAAHDIIPGDTCFQAFVLLPRPLSRHLLFLHVFTNSSFMFLTCTKCELSDDVFGWSADLAVFIVKNRRYLQERYLTDTLIFPCHHLAIVWPWQQR